MTAITTPTAGLNVLYLFPVYYTGDDYKEATGKAAPVFDPTKPIKRWQDPSAQPGSFNSYITLVLGAIAANGNYAVNYRVFYDDGGPMNVPANDADLQAAERDNPNTGKYSVPIPMRQLDPGEAIRRISPFEPEMVVNMALYAAQQKQIDESSGKFLAEDRALLQAIAAKLGA